MKLFKRKNFMSLFLSLLLTLPFLHVLFTSLYVVVNHNAYLSYSNFNANADQYVNLDSYNDLVVGKEYKLISNNDTTLMQSGNTGRMNIDNVHVISVTSNMSQYISDIESSTYVAIWYTSNYNSAFLKFENANTNFSLLSTYIECTFTYMSLTNVNETNDFSYYFGTNMYYVNHINQTNTLDKAFEYSISEFVDDNKFGKLDFFTWFSGLFLDNTIHDLLYIHFINWYLNYALYVSLSFLLFHFLYFFVDFIRKLMDRGNDLI